MPTRGIVLSNPAQRARAIRSARWHSRVVATLRVMLPVMILVLASGYIISLQTSTKIEDDKNRGTFNISSIDLLATRPTMRNPSYTGFNKKDGTEYTIRADRAVTDLDENKPIDLFGIQADVTRQNGETLKLTSAEGQFDRKQDRLELMKDIVVASSTDMTARLSRASVFPKQGVIISNEPVAIKFSAGTLDGNKLRVEQKKNEFHLLDGVIMRLQPGKGAKQANDNAASGLAGLTSQSDQPVDIKANKLLVQADKQFAKFEGNTIATQGDVRLTARAIDVDYAATGEAGDASEIKKIIAKDKVVITRDAERITTQLATFDAKRNVTELNGNVVITRGAERITTRFATFDTERNVAELIGDVTISSGDDGIITGDKAFLNDAGNTFVLTGKVIAKHGDNVMRGTRLDYDQKRGRLSLTNPTQKNGRISAKFLRQEKSGLKKVDAQKDKKVTKADTAKAIAFSNQTFQANPDAPVEIEALRLDIDEVRQRATFRKNVIITQGLFKIETAVVHADYAGKLGLTPNDNAATQSPRTNRMLGTPARLKSILAPQSVVVTSQNGQYASGQSGQFDVGRNLITLSGNVVLKQGRQLVRGERLVIDLTSGLSRIERGKKAGWKSKTASPSPPPARTSRRSAKPSDIPNTDNLKACGERMCAMFFPGDILQKKPRQPAPKAATTDAKKSSTAKRPADIGTGWYSSTSSTPPLPQPGPW